jgi:hypothetical protein
MELSLRIVTGTGSGESLRAAVLAAEEDLDAMVDAAMGSHAYEIVEVRTTHAAVDVLGLGVRHFYTLTVLLRGG